MGEPGAVGNLLSKTLTSFDLLRTPCSRWDLRSALFPCSQEYVSSIL